MKRYLTVLSVLMGILLFSGCRAPRSSYEIGVEPFAMRAAEAESVDELPDSPKLREGRKLIWTARMIVQVREIDEALRRVEEIVESHGGYIEQLTDGGETSARLTIRVPSVSFDETTGSLEGLGKLLRRTIDGRDVTEEYVDIEARMETLRQLRNRLLALLDKAEEVPHILAIERELSRVQAQLDALEARLKSLAARVEHSTITLSLERKPVFGPVSQVFRGLWWGIEKLFFIRR